LISANSCVYQIALSNSELSNEHRWDPGITRFGEVAVRGSSDEATVARWLEPPSRLTTRNECHRRRLLLLVIATRTTIASSSTAAAIAVLTRRI
jgi:hypothetical protein